MKQVQPATGQRAPSPRWSCSRRLASGVGSPFRRASPRTAVTSAARPTPPRAGPRTGMFTSCHACDWWAQTRGSAGDGLEGRHHDGSRRRYPGARQLVRRRDGAVDSLANAKSRSRSGRGTARGGSDGGAILGCQLDGAVGRWARSPGWCCAAGLALASHGWLHHAGSSARSARSTARRSRW